MSTLTQISNLFNLMVQQPNSGLKFYHFGWRSDINRNIDNNFDRGTETGRLFPALQFHVPEYSELKDGEKLQFEGYGEKLQITLWFDDLQDYENDGTQNTDNLIEQWTDLKKVADVFVINFNEIFSNHYKAGYLEDNIRFVPRSNLHNDRLVTWEVSFDLVHVVDCVDILEQIDVSQFPATFEEISIIDIENYNPATPPTRCDLILQQLTEEDLLNCILPTYDFSTTEVQDATTAQQQTDMTDWLCTPVVVPPPSSMSFDGVNERIILPIDSSLEFEYNTPFTLSTYIKIRTAKGQNIFNKWSSAGTDRGIFVSILGDNTLRFDLQNSAPLAIMTNTTTSLTTNSWSRIDVVFEAIAPTAANVKIFFNGVSQPFSILKDTLGNNTINDPSLPWYIGLANQLVIGFDGLLHEIKFYNTALNASDISTDNTNLLNFNNGVDSNYTPVKEANIVFRNRTGTGAVYGVTDWCFPAESGSNISSQSVLMEFADKSNDIPLSL